MGLTDTFKVAAAALRDGGVPFGLAGSAAAWARGGPEPHNDIDFVVAAEDAERAARALEAAGMRIEHPPEGWLLKAYRDGGLVDVIWELSGCPPIPELLERAEELSVQSVPMMVLALDDVMTSKLCAFDEQSLDFAAPLSIARALREQVDWALVRERTAGSPYARAFLGLLEELGVIERPSSSARGARHPRVRVVSGE